MNTETMLSIPQAAELASWMATTSTEDDAEQI